MSQLLRVNFRTTVIVPEKRPYTIYEIEVRASIFESPWSLYKRYSDFYNLHSDLQKLGLNDKFNLNIPPRRLIRSKAPDVVARRKKELQIYLQTILSIHDLMQNQLILDFLQIPESLQTMLKVYNLNTPSKHETQPMSIKQELEYEINLFLKQLSMQKNMVKVLHRFEQFYFDKSSNRKIMTPKIIYNSKSLIRKLFIGDDHHQGLIHCVRLLHSKVAWRAAISLLWRLLDIERNNYAEIFRNTFLSLNHGIYKQMYLHQHINDDHTKNDAFKIVQFIKNNMPTLNMKLYLYGNEALKRYNEWEIRQREEMLIVYYRNEDNDEIINGKGYDWNQMGYKNISKHIFNVFNAVESDDIYQNVYTMSKDLKVKYKKDIDCEEWKVRISFGIDYPAKVVYDHLVNNMVNCDVSWNTKIIEQNMHRQLDEKHYIVHQVYSSFNSQYKLTDFVLLTCLKCDVKNDRYEIVFASVNNYDDLGEQKGKKRAILLPSGFEIRPLKDDVNKCMVSYRLHMTNESVLTISADLLGETDQLFEALLDIQNTLVSINK